MIKDIDNWSHTVLTLEKNGIKNEWRERDAAKHVAHTTVNDEIFATVCNNRGWSMIITVNFGPNWLYIQISPIRMLRIGTCCGNLHLIIWLMSK